MAKFDRILSLFPAFFAATDRTKLLYEVVRLLAQPLEEADTHLFRIQRAHRIKVAEHVEDILRLAALLNLTAFHFEDIWVDSPLFITDLKFQNNLNKKRELSGNLREKFKKYGISFSVNAVVSIEKENWRWLIKDEKQVYTVRREKKFLFSIDLKFKSDLDSTTLSVSMRQEFKRNNISFSPNASISVIKPGTGWLIADENRTYTVKTIRNNLKVYEYMLNVYQAYNQKLALMRERVQRIGSIHLKGLGTPRAVMESAAIFLNAAIVPEYPGGSLIQHIDKELFSHKAIIEFSHLPEKPRERMYLHENPFRRKKIPLTGRWPLNSWMVENQNFEFSQVRLVIQGVEDRTVLPSIFCPETGEGILFNGIVPDGKTLIIDTANGAMLNNHPADEWLTYFQGGIFDYSNSDGVNFVKEEGDPATRFDGDFEKMVSRPFRKKIPVPTAPIGRSEWHFTVAQGIYDGSDYDFSIYATDPEPIGQYDEDFNFDQCVFDFPANGIVGMAWDERIPCSFKLLLPPNVPQLQSRIVAEPSTGSAEQGESEGQPINYVSWIGNILPRFKAAGVRAFVDTAKDAWILGENVLRNSAATEGEGVMFHATCLQDRRVDIFVPFDTTS